MTKLGRWAESIELRLNIDQFTAVMTELRELLAALRAGQFEFVIVEFASHPSESPPETEDLSAERPATLAAESGAEAQ